MSSTVKDEKAAEIEEPDPSIWIGSRTRNRPAENFKQASADLADGIFALQYFLESLQLALNPNSIPFRAPDFLEVADEEFTHLRRQMMFLESELAEFGEYATEASRKFKALERVQNMQKVLSYLQSTVKSDYSDHQKRCMIFRAKAQLSEVIPRPLG